MQRAVTVAVVGLAIVLVDDEKVEKDKVLARDGKVVEKDKEWAMDNPLICCGHYSKTKFFK